MTFVYLIFLLLSVMLTLYGIMTFISLVAAYIKHGRLVGFALGVIALAISSVALIGGTYGIWRYSTLAFMS